MINKRECPLMGKEVDDGVCFDISMVAEELAPRRTLPDGIIDAENLKEICLGCEFHRHD